MRLGTTEIILIVVLALVLFGGGKLAGVGKALGKSINLLPVSSLEQGSQSASDALFRDAVQKERVRIYDAAS